MCETENAIKSLTLVKHIGVFPTIFGIVPMQRHHQSLSVLTAHPAPLSPQETGGENIANCLQAKPSPQLVNDRANSNRTNIAHRGKLALSFLRDKSNFPVTQVRRKAALSHRIRMSAPSNTG